MYPVERYIQTLKSYVRNRAHPEGSIVEGYLADECLTFCSRYMNDFDTVFNRKARNDDYRKRFNRKVSSIGQGVLVHLDFEESDQIHSYILHNCDELVEFVNEHKLEFQTECPRNIEKRHKAQFSKLILDRVRKLHGEDFVDNDLYNLVCGPLRVARRYTGYIVNGYRFHTNDR
uniref:DUF4218 domain-containing protein n=1 Tax=Chenopodium quinoa TaxID=63459 RepID=A0A803MKL5_CHEQI